MNSRKYLKGAQDVSPKTPAATLEDHLSSVRLDLYLQLRVAVIAGFVENGYSNRCHFELLSNILLDMEEAYRHGSP